MPINLQYYSKCSQHPASARIPPLSRASHLLMDALMTHCSMLCQAFKGRAQII